MMLDAIPQTRHEAFAFIHRARKQYLDRIVTQGAPAESADLDTLRILADALTAIQTGAKGVVV